MLLSFTGSTGLTNKPVLARSDVQASPAPKRSAPTEAPPANRLDGARYYVAAHGDDRNPGTSPSAPWLSLEKVSGAQLDAGDEVLFNLGDVWVGTLNLRQSGTDDRPIVVGSYGSGELPVIEHGQSCVELQASFVTVTQIHARDCVWAGINIGGSNNRVEDTVVANSAAGVAIKSGAARNLIVRNEIKDNNRMSVLTKEPTNDDSGAFGVLINGDDNEVAHNAISGSHAFSHDYGTDGAAIEVFGGRRNHIHHNVTFENDTFAEMGNSRTADNTFAYNTVTSMLQRSKFFVTRGADDMFGPVLRTTLHDNHVELSGDKSEGFVCYAGCSEEILTMRNNVISALGKAGYADGPFIRSNNTYSGGALQGVLGAGFDRTDVG